MFIVLIFGRVSVILASVFGWAFGRYFSVVLLGRGFSAWALVFGRAGWDVAARLLGRDAVVEPVDRGAVARLVEAPRAKFPAGPDCRR